MQKTFCKRADVGLHDICPIYHGSLVGFLRENNDKLCVHYACQFGALLVV